MADQTDQKNNSSEELKNDLGDYNKISKFLKQDSIREKIEQDNLTEIQFIARAQIKKMVEKSGISSKCNTIFLVQDIQSNYQKIDSFTINRINEALLGVNKGEKDILLIINSRGGSVEPAYLISKCCKEYGARFLVSVPRMAKSAATLISLGADEIHMGSMSELGPIDLQINNVPTSSLSEGLELIADLVSKYPKSSLTFSRFLSSNLDLQTLGYMQRLFDSTKDYAKRLLGDKELPKSASEIAEHLVCDYKDHAFVIDKDEATEIFGEKMIKKDTSEYKLANEIYQFLEDLKLALWSLNKESYTYDFAGDYLYLTKEKR